jgi:hypothetical protein
MLTPERGQRFIDLVRSLQPGCLIDGRLGAAGDYRSTGDNRIPNTVMPGDWEVPATINHTWGYKLDHLPCEVRKLFNHALDIALVKLDIGDNVVDRHPGPGQSRIPAAALRFALNRDRGWSPDLHGGLSWALLYR